MLEQCNRLIVLAGIDGSGKSTQMAWIEDALRAHGERPHYVRLRWAMLISMPLIAIARLLGYSRRHYNPRSKTIVVEQLYHQWPVMRALWPYLFTVDVALTAWWKVLRPLKRGEWVLCDRYVLDAMVDLAAALRDERLLQHRFVRLLLAFIPRGACTMIIDTDPATAYERKLDVLEPSYLAMRRPLYLGLAAETGTPIVDGNQHFAAVQEAVASSIGITPIPEQRAVMPQGVA